MMISRLHLLRRTNAKCRMQSDGGWLFSVALKVGEIDEAGMAVKR